MNWRNSTVILALALAVIISIQIAVKDDRTEQQPRRDTWPGSYYMKKAELVGTGENGERLYLLSAEEAVHRAREEAVELTTVALDYQPSDGSPWYLESTNGRILDEQNRIELWGDVKVTRGPDAADPLVFTTDKLDIDADRHVAETDAPVLITMAGNTIESVGLLALLNEDKVTLKSQVHGTYNP